MELRMDLIPSVTQQRVLTMAQVTALRKTVPTAVFSRRLTTENTSNFWKVIHAIAAKDGYTIPNIRELS